MMQAIRDRAQSWLAWVIVGFISVPFALWGIQSYLGGSGKQNVAEVEGVEIGVDDFRRNVDNYRQQQRARLVQMLGNADNPLAQQLLDDKFIKKQVLEAMIGNNLMALAALKAGFRVDDEQINEIIRGVGAFQAAGKFDPNIYEQQLRNQGMSSKGFKARLSQDEISAQFLNGLFATAFVTPHEVDEKLRLQFQQRKAAYLVLKGEEHRHEMKINDEQIKAYYDSNIERYMTPEQVSLSYIELDASKIASNIATDDATLKTYYEERSSDYLVVDDREQRKLLADIKARLAKGEDFATLAKQYSQDRGTSSTGGDLDFIGRNSMDKPFEDALFALKQGEVSDIVETSFGLHLVKLEEVRGDERHARHILLELDKDKLRQRSFEEVRAQVLKDYRQVKADQVFSERYEQFNNLTYEHPDTLQVAADALGIEIKTTDLFTRNGGQGIASLPAVAQVAFSETVLNEGRNSEPLEIGQDHLLVVRVDKHIPATPRPLEDVNDDIINTLLASKSAEYVQKLGSEFARRLQEGGDADALAAEYKASWQVSERYRRDSQGIQPAILARLYAMARPADRPVYDGVVLANGDYAVVALHAVEDGDPLSRTSDERLAVERELTALRGNSAVSMLRTDLRNNADITVHDKNL